MRNVNKSPKIPYSTMVRTRKSDPESVPGTDSQTERTITTFAFLAEVKSSVDISIKWQLVLGIWCWDQHSVDSKKLKA